MKRPHVHIELTERQTLILALVLVILLAGSLLYCIGFASLAVREVWESGPLPWSGENTPEEMFTPTPLFTPSPPPSTVSPS